MEIQNKVKFYLAETKGKYEIGQPEYYAWLALEQALKAFEEKNYGIGAVAIYASENDIFEYRERNAMVTGMGVVDHAETRALLKMKGGEQPDYKYPREATEWTKMLPMGISVFGTLEPCPMCSCTLTNVGAMLSVSTVLDGKLILTNEGYKISDGAANVLVYEEANANFNKFKIQPQVWQWIQNEHKLKFEILKTKDKDLQELSMRIFTETREEIDRQLTERGIRTYSENRAKSLHYK